MIEDINEFAAQFFEEEKPPRDRSGRPLLIPRGVEIADENRVPYTRASGLGEMLEEFSYLWKWKMKGLTKGLADSMDLIRLAAGLNYTSGFAEDEAENRASGRLLEDIAERAMGRAGINAKADYGTAIHSRTEDGNRGTDPDEKQAADVESCLQLWKDLGVVHLGTEIFTACDETRSAGTFDNLSYVPGYGIIVTDKKTSSKAKATYDVQLSTYANSDVYWKDTDLRCTLEEYVSDLGWDPDLLRRDIGLIWWIKNGKTEARLLNLVDGFRAAKTAAWIRDERRTMGVAKNVTKDLRLDTARLREALHTRISTTVSSEELTTLWHDPTLRAIWTDEHTAAAKARKAEK